MENNQNNWQMRPTKLTMVPNDIKALIAIDESGTPDVNGLKKNPEMYLNNPSGDHFTLAACAIKSCDFEETRDLVLSIKYKYWKDGMFNYIRKSKEPEFKRVCFHTREINRRLGPFNLPPDIYSEFIDDLTLLMSSAKFTCFSTNIHKSKYLRLCYNEIPEDPYEAAMFLLLERIAYYLKRIGPGYLILESRGKKEDKKLLNLILNILSNGTHYNCSADFDNIKGIFFNPKWCGIDKSHWQLELADLLAYPLHRYYVNPSVNKYCKDFQVLEPKLFSVNGKVKGWGLKSLPFGVKE